MNGVNVDVMVDIVMILIIIIAFVIACFVILRRQVKEENENIKFSYQALCADTQNRINEIVGISMEGMGLSKQELYNQEQQRLTVSGYIRTCNSGDAGAREAMKELIRTYLTRDRGVDENTILYAIPFDSLKSMTARQMFEAMIYKLDEGRDIGFARICERFHWDMPDTEEGFTITEKRVRKAWEKLHLKLSYTDWLNVLVQMLYADRYGLGVIDTLNQQLSSIEEIQIGLCGLSEMAYHYKDEILGTTSDDRIKLEYSKDSIHILVRANCIRLAFLSFGTDDELQRVIRNLIKNSDAGELTVNNPKIVTDTVDGRRISVSRPPFSDAWIGFVRKFDAIRETDIYSWCAGMENGEKVADIVSMLAKTGRNIALTGETYAGKTTVFRACLLALNPDLAIRTIESESFEVNARRFLQGRNTAAFRVTDHTPEEMVLAFVRKTSGQVMGIGEVNSARMANHTLDVAKFATQLLFSAHYVKTEDMIAAFVAAKLCVGGYTNEKLAEMDVVRALHFDVHLAKKNGVRYVEWINEIIPDFDFEAKYDTEEISYGNAELKVASGLREVRKQLGEIKTYTIRPIMEYDLERQELLLHNKPSEESYKRAKQQMTEEQYKAFVDFFESHFPASGGREE